MKNYIFMATDDFIADRLRTEFSRFNNVIVHRGLFENIDDQIDCLVSPANSFGLMDGGMDAAITAYFGDQLQERVQRHIIDNYFGEQPVGTTFVIDTNNETIPYLAHSPTMRVPMVISETDNVYNAMRATLIATESLPEIDTVAVPALGHGAGGVHGASVAYQMAKAFLQVAAYPDKLDWNYAMKVNYAIKGV